MQSYREVQKPNLGKEKGGVGVCSMISSENRYSCVMAGVWRSMLMACSTACWCWFFMLVELSMRMISFIVYFSLDLVKFLSSGLMMMWSRFSDGVIL